MTNLKELFLFLFVAYLHLCVCRFLMTIGTKSQHASRHVWPHLSLILRVHMNITQLAKKILNMLSWEYHIWHASFFPFSISPLNPLGS